MKFSVIVVTYNPIFEKVKLTLDSILKQEFKDYEIVISDDGSEDNCFDKIEQYFMEHDFSRYVLVPHEKNQGTVKNLISALEHCSGKYVRDFGPGDLFYDKASLGRLCRYFEKRDCDMCFGLIKGYSISENGNVTYKKFTHPFDIQAYRKQYDSKRILSNLILYSDNVSGASTSYKRNIYLEYLKRIEDYVVYEEDIFQVLAALEGIKMRLYDDYLVWYEMGEGVSDSGNSAFSQKLALDVSNFYDMLADKFPADKLVIKRKKLECFYRIKNIYLRTLLRFFVNPDAIRYLFISFLQKCMKFHLPKKTKKGFLDDTDFLNETIK